jgi:hypothetical protein
MLALLRQGATIDERVIFEIMGHISAFTILGYAIAEYQGRRVEQMRGTAPIVIGWSLVLSTGLEAMIGWRRETPASALLLLFTVTAALAGAWMYRLQLRHVQALLGRRTTMPAGSGQIPPTS